MKERSCAPGDQEGARGSSSRLRQGRALRGAALVVLVWACSPTEGASDGVGGASTSGGSGIGNSGGSGVGDSGGSGGILASGGARPAGGASPSVGGADSAVGGAAGPRDCENGDPILSVTLVEAATVSELGSLFATDTQDNSGPTDWAAQYGKAPEIVPIPDGTAFAVLLQDQASSDAAYVVHMAPSGEGYALDAAYEVESLGRIMGLALDEDGNYFVATGVNEDEAVNETYPPNKIHRPDIVRVVKFDRAGCVLMESDVDMARGAADDEAEILVNPMVAGSARLAYGAGQLALVHSHNTEPDAALDGARHQKAITTHIDAVTGEVTRASTSWVSHSFDQRAFYDGEGFVELHLGDAYPRSISLGRYFGDERGTSHDIFRIKGALGDNNTFTRLGGIVQVADPEFGYLVLFSTERAATFDGDSLIRGTRDLALVRVRANLVAVDGSIVDQGEGMSEFSVSSADEDVVNHLRWLTDLGEDRHVERPRLVAVEDGTVIALWEEWSVSGNRSEFEGTFALRLDDAGEILQGPALLSEIHHIARGDDAVPLDGRALFVGGSSAGLELHFVAPDLTYSRLVVP